jgi:hypothetical protein
VHADATSLFIKVPKNRKSWNSNTPIQQPNKFFFFFHSIFVSSLLFSKAKREKDLFLSFAFFRREEDWLLW